MNESMREASEEYLHQLSIQERCYHPSGTFIRFEKEDLEQSIPSRFEQQVRSYPDRLAIKSNSDELTYHELNQAANRLARVTLAVSDDSLNPVAVLFDESSPAITAILGMLKAAKICVPLDS